jgi:hypothetical protein
MAILGSPSRYYRYLTFAQPDFKSMQGDKPAVLDLDCVSRLAPDWIMGAYFALQLARENGYRRR